MKWLNFYEGIKILDKYVGDQSGVHAEHDQFWAGPNDPDVVSAEDQERLKELGWFIDEEAWSCWV